jgi:hypothetical protein
MKQVLRSAVVLLALLACGAVLAQVAAAEVQGVETTASHSTGVSGWLHDGSVGEVTVLVRALDADGNPVAGAPVLWTVRNRTDAIVYVVGSSAMMGGDPIGTYSGMLKSVDGGVTDANGEAYLVVDSQTPGDASVLVTVGGVQGETYRGRDMRVVWF